MPDLSQPFELGFALNTIWIIVGFWVVGAIVVKVIGIKKRAN